MVSHAINKELPPNDKVAGCQNAFQGIFEGLRQHKDVTRIVQPPLTGVYFNLQTLSQALDGIAHQNVEGITVVSSAVTNKEQQVKPCVLG